MIRLGTGVLTLFLCVAALLIFLGQRIGDRARLAEQGVTVLMPLMPIGPRDVAHGDLIELVYDTPEILAPVESGQWPNSGVIRLTLDSAHIAHSPDLYEGGILSSDEVILNYSYGASGSDLWPSYRRRLAMGDSFFVMSDGTIADYRDARYAVLKVDSQGMSVVVGLADDEGLPIDPGS